MQKISLSFSSLQKVDKTLAVVDDDEEDDDDQFTHLLDYSGLFFSAENSHKNLPKINPTQSINLSQLQIHTSAEILFLPKIPTKISPKKTNPILQFFTTSYSHICCNSFAPEIPTKISQGETNPNQSFTTPSFVPKIFFILSSSLARCDSEEFNNLKKESTHSLTHSHNKNQPKITKMIVCGNSHKSL